MSHPAALEATSTRQPGTPRWVAPVALFLVAFSLFALTAARASVSLDVWSANYASWRIATTGVPWIDGVAIPELDDNTTREVWVLEAANGHTVIGRSPGVVAAGLPAYWLASGDTMTLAPGALTAALLTAVSVLLLFLALRTRLPDRYAVLATTVFGFATPVWTVAADGIWPHTVTVLGICGMAWASATGRWWLAGVFGGITLWGRLHAAVVVAALGLLVGARRRDVGVVVRVGAVSGLFLVLVCAWTRWMYGSWNPTASYDTSLFTGYAETNRLSVVNHLGFWVSPDRGLLVWTPVVLLLLPALVRSWRHLPEWARALVWGGLGYTLLQATLNRFSGGDTFFGYRLTLELLACATPALSFSAPRMGTWARRLFGPVVGLQFCAMLVGATTQRFFVLADDVWTDNALWMAAREFPGVVVPLVVLGLGAGVLGQRLWDRRARATAAA